MKLIRFSIFALTAIVFGSCCDTILDPYKDGVIPTTDQKVLLVDFTGDRCGNCPKGAEEAARLHELYGDKVIIVAMHTGRTFASPDPSEGFVEDFRTAAGEGLYDFFGGPGQPTGAVNYVKGGDGNYTMAPTNWASAISKELKKTPTMTIAVSPQFSTDSLLTVKADIKYKKASTGNHRIAMYLIEDSVVYLQKDYRKSPVIIPDYVHRHMLRGAISGGKFEDKYIGIKSTAGGFGDLLPATVASATASKTYTISFKGTKWNPKNCAVIVIINDKTTNNVLQVEEAHILK